MSTYITLVFINASIETLTQVVDIETNAVDCLHNQVQVANSLLHFIKETNNMDSLAEFKVPVTDPSKITPPSSVIADIPPLPKPDLNKEPLTIFERLNGTSST